MATNISEFKKLVAPDVIPCPDPIVNREIVGSILEFCTKTNILVKNFNVDISSHEITTTTQNSMDIDVTTILSGYRTVSILNINIDGIEYIPKRKEFYNTLEYFDQIKESEVIYFFLTDNTTIRLYDRSSTDGDLYLSVAVKPLRAATTVDDFIYEDFAETIAAGAKSRILKLPGQPWTNIKASGIYYNEWRQGLSKVRARVEKGFTARSQSVNWRSFGDLD